MMQLSCPCQSDKPYQTCCAPLHQGVQVAADAEQLMRSRYSAFVRQDVDYIVATTAPFQQALLDKHAIADWAKNTDWAGLKVIEHLPKLGKRHAQVEFNAFFNTAHGRETHHERSSFVKIGQNKETRWYFLDPTVSMTIPQKQPCPCGSGDKYKHCCGPFLGV